MDLVRFGVYWAILDPTIGSEIKKTRPVVIVSPDVVNNNLNTVLVAPLTSTLRDYPTRVRVKIGGKFGDVAIDQLRALDKSRIASRLGILSKTESIELINRIIELMKI